MAGGLLDRLRLTPERLADMAVQLDVLAATPEPPLQRFVRTLPTGRAGVRAPRARRGDRRGVRGPAERHRRRRLAGAQGPQRRRAAHRGRRAGQRDGAGRAGDRAVPAARTGSRPTPCSSSRPPGTPAPTRSSGCPTSSRSWSCGAAARSPAGSPRSVPPPAPACSPTPTAAGVLYLDASADEAAVARMVTDSTDRLGVCNRLNLLLIDRPALRPAVARRRGGAGRARHHAEPAAARAPRSATSGRWTPATRRT